MSAAPAPPRDPRLDRPVPELGSLPVSARLDELTVRVLAPNPSPMTLDGTNTYVIAEPGRGGALVIDPGPDDPGHRDRVDEVLAGLDAVCELVVVTHHHHDHSEAARSWARSFGCDVAATTPEVAGPDGRRVGDGDLLAAAGLRITAVATPGHTADHVAYRLPTGALLTGDHVLGRGTSVVAHPDGDLAAYLSSLRRVLDLGPDVLFPGHGPELTEDPSAVVRYYLEHRRFREGQILAVLEGGPCSPRGIVEVVYAEVDPRLWDAAEASTRAALAKLAGEGQVRWAGDLATLSPGR